MSGRSEIRLKTQQKFYLHKGNLSIRLNAWTEKNQRWIDFPMKNPPSSARHIALAFLAGGLVLAAAPAIHVS